MSKERKDGFLTEEDRRLLGVAKEEYKKTEGSYYAAKGRLRTGLLKTVKDFTEVQETLNKWTWNKLVSEIRSDNKEIRGGMTAAIALFYEIHEAMGWDFERTLWDAMEQAYTYGVIKRNLPNQTVDDVSFDVTLIQTEQTAEMYSRIEEKLENHKPLTVSEKAWLLETGGELRERWEDRDRESKVRREDRVLRKYDAESEDK